MNSQRIEQDSLGPVEVPADKLWGAQTQRSLHHFSIGHDLMPREMITAYSVLKKSAAIANHAGGRLNTTVHGLIVQACDEILAGQHHDMFPLHVWMTGSGRANAPARCRHLYSRAADRADGVKFSVNVILPGGYVRAGDELPESELPPHLRVFCSCQR